MSRILVISPTPTHPQDAGNRARINSLLFALRETGHKVYFAFVKREGGGDEEAMSKAWDGFFPIPYRHAKDRWRKRKFDTWSKRFGSRRVLPYRIDDWYDPEIFQHLAKVRADLQPDVVLVEYVFLSKALECFGPETLKVLDTHDIFGARHKLYRQNNMPPQWFYTTVSEEKKALDRADVVLAIQDEEAAYFKKLTSREVITVGHLAQGPLESQSPGEELDRLLFVGSANPINVEALNWFLKDVFPLVRRQLPGVELEVVGECANSIRTADGVILTGKVADLAPSYSRAKVVINPVRFGTGLKIKTIEALAHGRPLVTTSAGSAGLVQLQGKAFLIADSPAELNEAIQKLFASKELRSELIAGALEFSKDYNQTAIKPLLDIIDRKTVGAIQG